ncbi:hypothetical protein ASG73_11000 [Janibacter sp. Soil728]|uniref:SAV_6107 family HEPN domain-containing protein n=1 Tax=Janibacter sp. Soil728 TaxID=1736393 RepID=UPI0006FE5AD2|nr:SAV_6107 family HEPN domain-containing protein [Janibacter sp. Soil728]KRE36855.1 hypothetical protein ASG73_11000 [Janibacter sp. Soil728]
MVAVAVLHPDRLDGAMDLLFSAGESLAAAHMARSVPDRSAGTRLAVLRAAAAVLCVRGRPMRSGPVDVWQLLPQVAPELTEWADFFEVVLPEGGTRPGHGAAGPMSVREVDDLLRQGEDFVRIVAGLLGLSPVPVPGDLVAITGAPDLKEMRYGGGAG